MLKYLIAIFAIGISLDSVSSGRNNVCSTFDSYLFPDLSKNCYFERDIQLSMIDRLVYRTHRGEKHTIRTEDGYLIDLYHLKHPNPRGVVVLQHPLVTDSRIWMMQSNDSTALLFWRRGYDVWMPNNRGTRYGEAHVKYLPTDGKFWDFSFDDMGMYDQKATIDYIYKLTNRKVIYIGHSLSTTSVLVYASMRPKEAAEKVELIVLMGTVAYLKHSETPLVLITPFHKFLLRLNNIWPIPGLNRPEQTDLMAWALNYLPVKRLVPLVTSIGGGWNYNEFDPKFAVAMPTATSGFSIKLIIHLGQIYQNGGDFVMFDYGKKKNLKLYNQTTPPEYPIEDIKTPVYLVSSTIDLFSAICDNDILFNKLSPEAKIYGQMRFDKANHFDYHAGKHRKENIYEPLLKLFDNITAKYSHDAI